MPDTKNMADQPTAQAGGRLVIEYASVLSNSVESGETLYLKAEVSGGTYDQVGTLCWTFTDDAGYSHEVYCGDQTIPGGESVIYQPELTHGDLAYELGYGDFSVSCEIDTDDTEFAGTVTVVNPDTDGGDGDSFDASNVEVDVCSLNTQSVEAGKTAQVGFDLLNDNPVPARAYLILDEGPNTSQLASGWYVVGAYDIATGTIQFTVPDGRDSNYDLRIHVHSAERND